jgi:hypothetical protein
MTGLGAGCVAQMTERLPSKLEALNSHPSTAEKQKQKLFVQRRVLEIVRFI